jgi:hypothetical protein
MRWAIWLAAILFPAWLAQGTALGQTTVTVQNCYPTNVVSNSGAINGSWPLTPLGGGVYESLDMSRDADPIWNGATWTSVNPGVRVVVVARGGNTYAVSFQRRTWTGWGAIWSTGDISPQLVIPRVDPASPPFGPFTYLPPAVVRVD